MNTDYDTRPERPAHVPANATTFDPYHFDASNHSFATIFFAITITLLGIAIVIVHFVG